MWYDVGKPAAWWKFNIVSFQNHLKDFDIFFLELVKFGFYDTYIQSYGTYYQS